MRVGRYEVLETIGQGGMGLVFKARLPDGSLGAIKILRQPTTGAFARFERERRLQKTLGAEEGFVPILDAGESPSGPYIVMPFLGGGTLRERLARGPFEVADALALGRTLARALGRAHALGIVHRDLKPENVLFDGDGRPLIADFGLAKHFLDDAPGASRSVALSRTGEMRGTAGYMAPEQMKDARSAGPAADVFALGAILHECLAGSPAFAGGSLLDVLAKVEAGTTVSLAEARPEAPSWFVAAIERALAPEPSARFRDASGLAQALEAGPPARRRLSAIPAALAALVVLGGGGLLLRDRWRAAAARAAVTEGERFLEAKDYASAAATFGRAVELEPGLAAAWDGKGYARGALGETDAAIVDLTHALELDPRLERAYARRARAWAVKGEPDRVIADAGRALDLDPVDADAWHNLGWGRLQKGDLDGAIEATTRELALDARRSAALVNRGTARGRKGDVRGAVLDMEAAVAIDPGLAAAWASLGTAHQALDDWGASQSAFGRAIELDPKNVEAWIGRAAVRRSARNPEGAIADATHALELDGRSARALVVRADAEVDTHREDEARADLTRALELEPRNAGALGERAGLFLLSGAYDRAAADAAAAVALDPKNARAWVVHAAANLNLEGDPETTVMDATRAIELDPGLAAAWAFRADARQRQGDTEGAIADFEKSLELDPGNEAVRRGLEGLKGR